MRTTTWNNIGVSLDGGDYDEVMKKSGLDYEVTATPLYTEVDGKKILIPDRRVITKDDGEHVFGIVSDRYKICQNRDAFEFVKYIDGVKLIKAGSTDSGLVYMIGELPEVKILDDSIKPNLIFQNTHDGSGSVKATICMLRIICQNQFVSAFRDSPATVSIRHSGNLNENLLVARETMSSVSEYLHNYQAEATELATKKMTTIRFNKILAKYFETKEEYSDRTNQRIEMERDRFMQAYNADDNANFVGTKWGVINAYSDFITHSEPTRKSANWEEIKFVYYMNPSIMTNFLNFVKSI